LFSAKQEAALMASKTFSVSHEVAIAAIQQDIQDYKLRYGDEPAYKKETTEFFSQLGDFREIQAEIRILNIFSEKKYHWDGETTLREITEEEQRRYNEYIQSIIQRAKGEADHDER
jgi:hypothetical protein